MSEIDIELISLYHLDVSSNKVEKTDISIKIETIVNYVDALIEEILDGPNRRLYIFKDGPTEVKSTIPDIIAKAGNYEKLLHSNAKRLLVKEVKTDKRLQQTLKTKVQEVV